MSINRGMDEEDVGIYITQGVLCYLPSFVNLWNICVCVCVCVCVCCRVLLFATLWTIAFQAPPSMGFSRQEYWSGLPCPPQGDLPDPGSEPGSSSFPALAGGFFTTRTKREAPTHTHTQYGILFSHKKEQNWVI